MTLFLSRAALALLAAAAPLALHAQALTPQQTRQIDGIVTSALAKTGVPSASIAVVRDGKIVLTKAYGRASPEIATARADLPYQIASISKQFTAAAMLMLADEGKLSLDDHVSKYIPGVSGGDQITLRQLLSHTSGLQDYWPQDYEFAAMEHPTTPQAIVDRWGKKPLDFAPGTQWQYSNTGYVVAGMIVEKVAGMPLLDFLRQRVFQPLGMTSPMDQDKARGAAYPTGYHRYALGPVRAAAPPAAGWLFAAGELSMTARDLARWDVARMNRELLPAADWKEQETPVALLNGKSTGYGLGVSIGEMDGRPYIEHSGEAVGFLSENIVFPDQKTAVVVLTNSDFSDAFTSIAKQVTAVVLPPAAGAVAGEPARTDEARAFYDGLVAGRPDRSKLTADAAYYFTPTAIGDYHDSLSKLGTPTSFEAQRGPRLRGGFVNRNYKVTYPNGTTLNVITYAEPGANGRWEQFLVQPSN